MKRSLFFILLFVFSACSKFTQDDILGKWEMSIPFKVLMRDAPKSHAIIHSLSRRFWDSSIDKIEFHFLSDGSLTLNGAQYSYKYLEKEIIIKIGSSNWVSGSRSVLVNLKEYSKNELTISFDDNQQYILKRLTP